MLAAETSSSFHTGSKFPGKTPNTDIFILNNFLFDKLSTEQQKKLSCEDETQEQVKSQCEGGRLVQHFLHCYVIWCIYDIIYVFSRLSLISSTFRIPCKLAFGTPNTGKLQAVDDCIIFCSDHERCSQIPAFQTWIYKNLPLSADLNRVSLATVVSENSAQI